ncbi:TetR/AcrR family transcriptional regulator [Pseudofrankia inefficax]|uniref:Regulatory protein TetR n=1 Tax=Pseudofrankia inefficax (strain DSM 45817 / CECT 9037 / DDB 130130 / EuI1c) TaxID=298654 RepID=E3IVS8_PSEI1|nr:TetR/AcrR family transcriptional regulator [Pseudofrankia inefficax]ADP83730.1 regulatory protein TetR [Pseudofrankia inefficax]
MPSNAPKGGLRAAQRAFTHTKFIDAAVIEFAERGYARTTVDDIVSRAGATRATFYLHFRGKADILRELYDRLMATFEGIYDEMGSIARQPTLESIRGWLRTDVARWASIRQYGAPLWEGSVIDPEIRTLVEQGYKIHIRYLAEALVAARENLALDDAEITAAILLAPLRHFFDPFVQGRLEDTERIITVLASAWMAVIKETGSAAA